MTLLIAFCAQQRQQLLGGQRAWLAERAAHRPQRVLPSARPLHLRCRHLPHATQHHRLTREAVRSVQSSLPRPVLTHARSFHFASHLSDRIHDSSYHFRSHRQTTHSKRYAADAIHNTIAQSKLPLEIGGYGRVSSLFQLRDATSCIPYSQPLPKGSEWG